MSKRRGIPNPGLTVTFLLRIDDVTDEVLSEVKNNMNGRAQNCRC
jgi:5-hydroxyisourate hydrolase-like protein (transthyretin family)